MPAAEIFRVIVGHGGNHSLQERVASTTFEYSLRTIVSGSHLVLWSMVPCVAQEVSEMVLPLKGSVMNFFACNRCHGFFLVATVESSESPLDIIRKHSPPRSRAVEIEHCYKTS